MIPSSGCSRRSVGRQDALLKDDDCGSIHRMALGAEDGRQDALFKDDDCGRIHRMALGAEDVMHEQEV